MRWNRVVVMVVALAPTCVRAQESYKVEALKEAPPAGLSDAIKAQLNGQGYRVVDDQGNAYAEFWLRKAVPASSAPAGPKGAVQFPFLAEGELLGALRFSGEGHDYRDQTIAPGVYTLRYGLQPVNGDHLGVSTYRDYALLLRAEDDKDVAPLAQQPLEEESAGAAGTSHPAVLMLLSAPKPSVTEPSMVHDEQADTWGAVVPLNLAVTGGSGTSPYALQLVLVGFGG